MYCKHCGKEIFDESKFCRFCGTDLQDVTKIIKPSEVLKTTSDNKNITQTTTTSIVTPTVIQQPALKKKNSVLPIVLAAIFLLSLLSGVYFLFFSRKTIDPKDFVTVKVDDSLNGYANADVYVDYDKLTQLIGEKNFKNAVKKIMTDDEKKFIESSGMSINQYLDSDIAKSMYYAPYFINAYSDNTNSLSNNQEVVVKFDSSYSQFDFDEMTKILNIKLPKEYKYKVNGLEEGKSISIILPNIENYISFYGKNGNASAVPSWDGTSYVLENDYKVQMANNIGQVTHNGNYVGNIVYEISNINSKDVNGGLSQGDIIKVIAMPDTNLVKEFINNKLSVIDTSVDVKVDKIIEYASLDNIDNNQLFALGEEVVINTRNSLSKYCPYLIEEFAIKNKTTGETGLAYLFSTNEKDYYVVTQDVYKVPNSNELISNGIKMDSLGKNGDIAAFLKDYELISLGNEVNSQKYAVGKEGQFTLKGVRVRSGPSVNSVHIKLNNKAAYYEEGEVVKIIDETRDSDNDIWYQVEFVRDGNTYRYWSSGMYITLQ